MNTNTNTSVTANTQIKSNTAVQSSASLIKPKYLKDKSVFYKNSSYLKDLLGEK